MDAIETQAVNLVMGRIFGMMQRPERDGDVADYERCRRLILDLCGEPVVGYAHDYSRDRLKGAAGDH